MRTILVTRLTKRYDRRSWKWWKHTKSKFNLLLLARVVVDLALGHGIFRETRSRLKTHRYSFHSARASVLLQLVFKFKHGSFVWFSHFTHSQQSEHKGSFELLIPCFAISLTMEMNFRLSVEVTHVVFFLFCLRMPLFI